WRARRARRGTVGALAAVRSSARRPGNARDGGGGAQYCRRARELRARVARIETRADAGAARRVIRSLETYVGRVLWDAPRERYDRPRAARREVPEVQRQPADSRR